MSGVVELQVELGIGRFKTITIAEAEMAAAAGVKDVLLAFPLVGPNIERFAALNQYYTATEFWAIGDNYEQLSLLGQACVKAGITAKLLIDVNPGMNRTECPFPKLRELSLQAAEIDGLHLMGYHCYDGHLGITNLAERTAKAEAEITELRQIYSAVEIAVNKHPVLVMGGTPTFPCHAKHENVFLSPGTLFIQDSDYAARFPDLAFTPGAALLSRVVSHPDDGVFTLDLGYKGIAADKAGERGYIVGYPNAKTLLQSEEYWVFEACGERPPVGAAVYVIPAHICPTSALYSEALVIRGGELVNIWNVTARNRKIHI